MKKLGNYVTGRWVTGEGDGQVLADAVTGVPLYEAGTRGIDFQEMLNYARSTGNPALRKMSFHERGRMLKALAIHQKEKLEKFLLLVVFWFGLTVEKNLNVEHLNLILVVEQ